MTKVPSSRKGAAARQDVLTPTPDKEDVKRFDKAAKTFTGKATESRQTARQTLIGLGISTQTGKLTKRYR
jgi:hypothetical protein